MKNYYMALIAIFLVTTLQSKEVEGEYSYAPLMKGTQSLAAFYSAQGAPDVYTSTECSGKGKSRRCWPVIRNSDDRILASYGTKDGVGTIASGRYANRAFLYYYHSYKRGKDYYTDYYLVDNSGHKYDTPASAGNSVISSKITYNHNLLEVTTDGLYLNGSSILSSDETFTHAKITNNLSGKQSIIAITKTNRIFISNTKVWKNTKATLASKGDREGILSVYPQNDVIVYSVYKYVNSYNKGLILGRVNFKSNENIYGWLINSENRNIGFDPIIYIDGKDIVVSATNSSERTSVYTLIPNDGNLKKIAGIKPKHIEGFEDEKMFSFLAGSSLSKITWDATNDVEDENDNSYGSVEYDISDSIYKSVYFQGKIGSTQLAVSQLKNEAEAKGGATKKASQFTSAVVDIDGFFSPQSSLRIISEKGEVNGLATLKDKDGQVKTDIHGNPINNLSIETTMQRISLFVMKERGLYHGLDYTTYVMPSLMGFGKDGSVKFILFDPEVNIKKITYNIGYDELSYAKRYENNFSRLYFQGLLGIGIAKLSGDFEKVAEQKAKDDGYDGISTPTTFAVDYALDLGYIWQRKSKTLKGLGFSTQVGYKVKGTYYTAGSSSDKGDSDSESNSLTLEFERNDIWHGPYVSVNIIF